MDSDHPRIDADSPEPDRRPLHWSDAPPSGNADPILWQHEINARASARSPPGHGKVITAVLATAVFLGIGFAIGAPIYALSRWWASKPIASMESRAMVPAAAPAEPAEPTHVAPSSAAAVQEIALGQDVVTVTSPLEAGLVMETFSDEAPAGPTTAVEELASEPPPAGPLQSASPPPAVESAGLDPAATGGVRLDPVTIEGVRIDPVTIERVTIDPVGIDRVRIDPVKINPVKIDPVKIDRVTIDPVPINLPVKGPAGGQ